jgi:hypothetical protein
LRGAWLCGLVLVVVGCGSPYPQAADEFERAEAVYRYCAYGAVSEAQLEGCKDHVTFRDVQERSTNAADYAFGGGECLADSGPFCE